MHDDNSTAGAAAAVNPSAICAAIGTIRATRNVVRTVVGGTRAAPTTHYQGAGGCRESGAAETTIRRIDDGKAVPAVTTYAARAAIRTGTAAGIEVIGGRMAIRSASAGVAGCAARKTAAG